MEKDDAVVLLLRAIYTELKHVNEKLDRWAAETAAILRDAKEDR
jgi:hypothetical protein